VVEIKINGQKMTIEEAKAVYEELHKLFGKQGQTPYNPIPVCPIPERISPWEPVVTNYPIITC